MKHFKLLILFVFSLLSVPLLAQVSTGQEEEFNYGIKNNSSQTITTPEFLVTQGTDGTQGKMQGSFLDIKTENSAGAIQGFTLTNNGNGTVNISSGTAYLRTTNDPYSSLNKYTIPGVTNLELSDNANNFILVDYNSGTPALTVTTNTATINTQTNSIALVVSRVGNTLDYLSLVGQNVDANAKLRIRFLNQEGIRRANGAIIGFSNRNLTLTASTLFSGLIRVNAPAFNTSTTDTFTQVYNNGAVWTRTTGLTQVNNTQYNNAGTLTDLPVGDYRTDFIYLLPNNPSKLYLVLGNTNYPNIGAARGATVPSTLPSELQSLGVLVGRSIIQRLATSISEVASSFDVVFTTSPVTDHNSLSGIQGGTVGDYQHLTTTQVNSMVTNPSNFTSDRIPYTTGSKTLTDSSRLLWNNTTSNLSINGTQPIFSIKENLNNKTIDFTTNGPGSNALIIRQNGGKKRLTLEGEDASGFGEARLGIGNFSGGIPTESQVFVYGGNTGANIDARGSTSVDESNIDLEGSDWTTNINSLGLSYFGPNRTGLTPIYGYAKNKLGQIRFQNASTALITSINETSTVTPIRFGINTAEIANINDKGFSYQSDFSLVNSSNPRWIVDKGYVDGLVVGLLDDRGSYNASGNVFPTTGGSGVGGAVLKGDLWYVSTAGTLGGRAVNIGDSFRALVDSPGQTVGNWSLLSSNLSYVPANDASVLHRTGDESFSGLKSASQFGGSLNLTVTGGSGAALSVNTTAANGALAVGSTSSGNAITVNSYSTGDAIIANIGVSGTGYNFVGKNNLSNTFTVNKIGDVTGNKFVKTGGTASQYLMADGSTSTLTNPVTGTGTINYLPKFTGAGTIGNSQIFDNGTNVGIGTSNPIGKLQLDFNSGTTAGIILNSNVSSQGSGSIQFFENGSGRWNLTTNPNNDIFFYNESGSASGTNLLIQKSTGNVGIGANNPQGKLDIALGNDIVLRSLENSGKGELAAVNYANSDFKDLSLNGKNLIFKSNDGTERMRITDNGNIGIGTNNPLSRLHISSSAGTTYPTLGTQSGHFFLAGDDGKYGLMGGIHTTTGATWFQAMRNDAATAYALIFQPVGGNTLIGTTTDNGVDKLQVNGTISTTGLSLDSLSDFDSTFNAMPINSQKCSTTGTVDIGFGGGFSFVESFKASTNDYGMQRITYIQGTPQGRIFIRTKNAGTWSAWVEK